MSVSLIGVPFDCQSSYMRGAAAGPRATLEALRCDSTNMWTETGFDLSEPLARMTMADIENTPEGFDAIYRTGLAAGKSDSLPLFLGGDHSITYPLVKGMREAVGDFAILHFDAHPDCYDAFKGNRLSHASPFARIMEEGLCARLVSVGIRTAHGHQREQRERFGMEWLEMKDHATWPLLAFDTPVYISVDLDALDPAYAPGVSHHEPGGMSTRHLLDSIQAVDAPIVGADVVELNPERDVHGVTGMVAAKIVREIAGVMLRNSL